MKIGITTGVYIEYPVDEAIQRVAEAGFDGIDFWCGRPHIYRRDYTNAELSSFRKTLEGRSLRVPSLLPAFFRYPHSVTSPNKRVWEDSLEYMEMCVENAAELGAPLVLLVPGKSLYGQSSKDAWERMREAIDRICLYATAFDICIGIEVVNHFVSDLINTAADAQRILADFKHANLGVVLDSGHMNLSTDSIQQAVTLLGERLLQVHVNDNDGVQQQNLVPGDGTFDFNSLIATLEGVGFDGFLTAELGYQYSFDPDSAARLTAERLRALLFRGKE